MGFNPGRTIRKVLKWSCIKRVFLGTLSNVNISISYFLCYKMAHRVMLYVKNNKGC